MNCFLIALLLLAVILFARHAHRQAIHWDDSDFDMDREDRS